MSGRQRRITDHILAIVDLQNITKPEIVSKWWLPGMHRAGGEPNTLERGKRVALHHMIVAGDRGYGAWRDGGFTIRPQRQDEAEAAVTDQLVAAVLRRYTRRCRFRGAIWPSSPTRRTPKCAKGLFSTFIVDVRAPEEPVPISTARRRDVISAASAPSSRTTCTRTGGSFQSEETIFATYMAGVRVFDIRVSSRRRDRVLVPPTPKKLIDPRPNVSLAAKTADIFVTKDGLIYASDWNAGLNVCRRG